MSHLGDTLSALVDGELSGAELDRANAHLAACGACRVEARALRRLKDDLRSLAEPAGVTDTDQITGRLLAMAAKASLDAQLPRQRKGGDPGDPGDPGAPGGLGGLRPRRLRAMGRRAGTGPHTERGRTAARPRRRGRYVLWTTLSLVVVGIGTAFGLGGGSSPGPKVTPQLEVFDAQHAVTSGDVPFASPEERPSRVPVGAARP
jgi:anti-sigma factor RsiW